MKTLILWLALLLPFSSGWAQTFTQKQLQADLQLLQQKILEFNPATTKYSPDFDAEAEKLIQRYGQEANHDLYACYQAISELCALGNEGHFAVGNWKDSVHAPIINDIAGYMPFAVEVFNDQLYVFADLTPEGGLEKGDRILSINGKQDTELIEDMRRFVSSDGDIRTYQTHKLSDNFPWYYFFFVERTDAFALEVLPISGKPQYRRTVLAQTRTQRIANHQKRKSDGAPEKVSSIADFYTLELQGSTAILTLKSFDWRLVEKYDLKAKKFYASIFDTLAQNNIENLIIDIRGNTGGRYPFGDELVPFILKDGTATDWLVGSISWQGKKKTRRFPKAAKQRFGGTIYTLVDGQTFSTGANVARFLKEYGKAIVIGEETGTRYQGYVAGSKQYVMLPATQIEIGVPCYEKIFPESKAEIPANRGLIPDHEVLPTVEDWLSDKDPALEKALMLIAKAQR